MSSQYRVEKYESHDKMQQGLNQLAVDRWEPVAYAINAVSPLRATHVVIFRREA